MRPDTVRANGSDRQDSTRLVLIALSVMALIATVLAPSVAYAASAVTVTPASDGTLISIDTTTATGGTSAYTSLGDIVIEEGVASDIASATTEIVFAPPVGFEFNPASGAVIHDDGGDISESSITISAESATVLLTLPDEGGESQLDTLTIRLLEVRPTNDKPSSGDITASGDFTIAGVTASTNFGSLSSVPGALANFGVLAGDDPIGGQTAGQSFNLQFTARDQFDNTLDNVNDATEFTGTVEVSSNIAGSAGLGTSDTFANGVLASHAVTLAATSTAATITVDDTSSEIQSTSDAFTVSPGFTSVTPAALGQGVTTEDLTVVGAGFDSTAAVTFSAEGITVNSTKTESATELTVNVTIDGAAATGTRNLTITNGDETSVTANGPFRINAAPTVTSLAPNSLAQGVSDQDVVVTGTGFVAGAVASFSGAGITATTTFDSSTKLTLSVSVASGAATGSRDLTVTNTDKGSVTSDAAFTVDAAPAFASATTNTAGTTITVTLGQAVADPAGLHGQFTFKVNAGTERNFTQAQAGTSSQVVLTVDGAAIASGATVTVSYTAGSLVGTDGGVVASFTDQTVTNAVPAPVVTDPPDSTITEDVPVGGNVTLLPDGESVSATQSVDVSVTTPQGGTIEIVADTSAEADAQSGFSMLGVVIEITAPAATPEAPLSIPFTLHSSLFDGMDPQMIVPMRNGTPIASCTGASGVASPDPCVASKAVDANGNVVIHVLTSSASTWTLGEGESCQAGTFVDVTQGGTHTTAIDCALQFGIVHGFGDGSYGPDASIRRDQMASAIVRTLEAAGHTLPQAAHTFTDIAGNMHADAIGRLTAAGIVSGTTVDTFDPNASVRRDQMATLLIQAATWANVDTTATTSSGFGDIDGNVHQGTIDAATKLGLTFGVTDATYNPSGLVRRDQMASFLIRHYELL